MRPPIPGSDAGSQRRFRRFRPAASILDGQPSIRLADKCARLYRASTRGSTAHSAGGLRTAALSLSYVGADQDQPTLRYISYWGLMQTLSIMVLTMLAQRLNS